MAPCLPMPACARAAEDTVDDLMGRLAVVPMVLEARGLDVTPGMIEIFKRAKADGAVSAFGNDLCRRGCPCRLWQQMVSFPLRSF